MGRLLAIDYGRRRTGLAVTDPLRIIATGLATVATAELMTYLDGYLAHETVDEVVIGEPRQMDGTPSENLERARQFAARWRKSHPDIPIVFWDERFTSVLAHKAMLDGGLRKKARQDKATVDRVSATILLQDYMGRRQDAPMGL